MIFLKFLCALLALFFLVAGALPFIKYEETNVLNKRGGALFMLIGIIFAWLAT